MADEKRLIDAVLLEARIYDSKKNNSHMDYLTARNHYYEHDHFLKMVCSMPAVDAVEVVRCADCEYWCEDTLSCTFGNHYDDNWYAEDFCSYGKKKNGGNGYGI